MPKLEIIRSADSEGGRYFATLENGEEAEMTWREAGPGRIAVTHTFVPPAYRGQDLALQLVMHGIDDARGRGLKIVPICPYVARQFRRHPEWADVLAGPE